MFTQSFFNFPFSTDRVLIEQTSVSANIERQIFAALRKKDRRFFERVRVTELIEHVLVGWRDLRDNDFGLHGPDGDVLKNDPWSKDFTRVMSMKTIRFYHWLYDVGVKRLIGIGKLHYHKSGPRLTAHSCIRELDPVR